MQELGRLTGLQTGMNGVSYEEVECCKVEGFYRFGLPGQLGMCCWVAAGLFRTSTTTASSAPADWMSEQ